MNFLLSVSVTLFCLFTAHVFDNNMHLLCLVQFYFCFLLILDFCWNTSPKKPLFWTFDKKRLCTYLRFLWRLNHCFPLDTKVRSSLSLRFRVWTSHCTSPCYTTLVFVAVLKCHRENKRSNQKPLKYGISFKTSQVRFQFILLRIISKQAYLYLKEKAWGATWNTTRYAQMNQQKITIKDKLFEVMCLIFIPQGISSPLSI